MPSTNLQTTGTLARNKPAEVWLAMTGLCNLACLHCPRDAETAPNETMAESVLDTVFEHIFPHLTHINLGGNNLAEQFLSRDLARVIDAAVKHGVRISVTTNATVVRADLIEKLVVHGAEFRISMEGTENSWEAVRGARWSTFQQFIAALQAARAKFPASDCAVKITFTAFASNVEQLPAVIRLAHTIRPAGVHVQNLLPIHPDQQLQSLSYNRSLANRIFSEAQSLATELDVDISLPPQFSVGSMKKSSSKDESADSATLTPCYYPWTAANILENGDVTPCCISNNMIMGNLKKQSFESIWNGRAYQTLRSRINSNPYGSCKNCPMRAGSGSDAAALQSVISSDDAATFVKNAVRQFLIARGRKDVLKTLIQMRDSLSRGWTSYRNRPALIIQDLVSLVTKTRH